MKFLSSLAGLRSFRYGSLIDSTKTFCGRPLQFQVGCSGPCIHVQILNCSNVAALDSNNLSDPYVAVWWKDTMIGTTRIIMKNRSPEWPNETFVVPLEKDFMKAFSAKEKSMFISNKNRGKEHSHNDKAVWRPGDSLEPEEASAIIEEVNGQNELAKLPKLRLDVFDYDRFSKNDFLGQKTFSDNEMLQILFEDKERLVRHFDLEPKKARGVLGMKLGLVRETSMVGVAARSASQQKLGKIHFVVVS